MFRSDDRHGKKRQRIYISVYGLKDHTMSLDIVNVNNKTLSRITDAGLLDRDSEAYGPRERHRTSSSNSSLAVEPGILELCSQGGDAERLNRERIMKTLLVSVPRDSEREERWTIRRLRGEVLGKWMSRGMSWKGWLTSKLNLYEAIRLIGGNELDTI